MGDFGIIMGQQKATSNGRCWAYNGAIAGLLAMGDFGIIMGQQKATSYGRCWAYNGTTAGPLTKGVVTS